MKHLTLLNPMGDFQLRDAQLYPQVCFPLVNAGGMISSVTPLLTVELYLNETGDQEFLLEREPYFRDQLPHRGRVLPCPSPVSRKPARCWSIC